MPCPIRDPMLDGTANNCGVFGGTMRTITTTMMVTMAACGDVGGGGK